MNPITLTDIVVYPVKSLSGIRVAQWPVTKTGLRYDRQWMLVDRNGQFLSQRKIPRMALVKTALDNENLVLSVPDREHLVLPLSVDDGERVSCTIWQDRCLAIRVSHQADQWLSDFLELDCRLVFQPEHTVRAVEGHYACDDDQVAFSDGFPFLIISEGSLAALNAAMPAPLPMNRFRPNLVVSGCEGYAEDYWREIVIGTIGFRLPKPCSRCSVPTVNQETGESGKEPLATLNRSRLWQNKVYFGQNALHNQCGQLVLGDVLSVQLTGPPQPPLGL